MKRLPTGLLLCFTGLTIPHIQFASAEQPGEELSALRSEIESLKAGQVTIRQDLREIKDLLKNRSQSSSAVSDVDFTLIVANDPVKGAVNARVTLIEFSDYQCPFCARHAQTVLPQLEKNYISTSKLRYVLRDYPMQSIHPQAPKAHEAAHCAGDQDRYWEMRGQLFANQRNLRAEQLSKYAQRVGLADLAAFERCLDSGKYTEWTKTSVAEGTKAGVRGTPSFLLGLTNANGSVKAVKMIQGAHTYAVFQKVIDELLVAIAADNSTKKTLKND